ncbi:hypothetical protein KKH05_00300 [Patescibacteria group bacterium]|nr:hypothetical protein [Patescibacteria group bacterium]
MQARTGAITDPKTGCQLGIRLHEGSGDDFVVVHAGYITSLDDELMQIHTRLLSEALPEKNILMVEPPGIGESSKDLAFVPSSWPSRSQDVMFQGFGFLAEAELRALFDLGVRRMSLVGLSMGSNFLAKLGRRARERITIDRFINVSGVVKRWGDLPHGKWKLFKAYTAKKQAVQLQAIRQDSTSEEVRGAVPTEKELLQVIRQNVLGGRIALMYRYLCLTAGSTLEEDVHDLLFHGIDVRSIIGHADTISDTTAYGEFPNTEFVEGNHASVTSDPAFIVPLIAERLR